MQTRERHAMNLYSVTNCECKGQCDPEWQGCSWACVWADSEEHAIGTAQRYFPFYSGDGSDLRAEVLDTRFTPEEATSHCEDRNEVLREVFAFHVGDLCCDTCGLYEMGGEFPVCDKCYQCCECGCSCEEKDDGEALAQG